MIEVDLEGDTQLIAKLDAIPARLQEQLTKRLTALSEKMVDTIKDKLSGQVLNVRSGNLRKSIHYTVDSQQNAVTATVFSEKSVKYGRIQEYGGTTRPHVIEPRAGGVLAFEAGGRTVFASRVNHPGSKIPARPFMRPTLEEYRGRIVEGLNQAAQDSIA